MGSSNYQEVVVATYGGRVFGLSREPVTPKPISQEVQAKLDSLKQVAVLEKGWEMEEGGRGSGEAEGKRWGGGREGGEEEGGVGRERGGGGWEVGRERVGGGMEKGCLDVMMDYSLPYKCQSGFTILTHHILFSLQG